MQLTTLRDLFHNTWVILRKDIRVWLRNPATIAVTLLPPIALLFVQLLGASAVGRNPVALVVEDTGPKGQQMAQIFRDANLFRLHEVTAQQAQAQLRRLDVVAVITIPTGFTQRVQAHDPSPIDVTVNNLNLDFTNDIRRSVPDAITQFYQAQGAASPIKITLREHDLRQRDVEFFQYNVLPTLVLLLTISGLINGGIATAREWEFRTVKELLLSPASGSALIAGKVLASFATTYLQGLLVLGLGYIFNLTRPEGIYWLTTLFIMALVALFSSALGVALGAATQRIQTVIPISTNVSFYLFFLAGGIGVLAFEPAWLQNIAAYIPLTYGIHALQMAIFYSSSDQLGRDVAVMSVCALAAIGLGILSLRRKIIS